jgi:hypothetical protein
MILEMKFAYVVFIYACLFTIWRQNTFLTNSHPLHKQATNSQYIIVMRC